MGTGGESDAWEPRNITTTPTATTAQLVAVDSDINIDTAKRAGFAVFNITTNIPVWAAGSSAGAAWVDATGATTHSPV